MKKIKWFYSDILKNHEFGCFSVEITDMLGFHRCPFVSASRPPVVRSCPSAVRSGLLAVRQPSARAPQPSDSVRQPSATRLARLVDFRNLSDLY